MRQNLGGLLAAVCVLSSCHHEYQWQCTLNHSPAAAGLTFTSCQTPGRQYAGFSSHSTPEPTMLRVNLHTSSADGPLMQVYMPTASGCATDKVSGDDSADKSPADTMYVFVDGKSGPSYYSDTNAGSVMFCANGTVPSENGSTPTSAGSVQYTADFGSMIPLVNGSGGSSSLSGMLDVKVEAVEVGGSSGGGNCIYTKCTADASHSDNGASCVCYATAAEAMSHLNPGTGEAGECLFTNMSTGDCKAHPVPSGSSLWCCAENFLGGTCGCYGTTETSCSAAANLVGKTDTTHCP